MYNEGGAHLVNANDNDLDSYNNDMFILLIYIKFIIIVFIEYIGQLRVNL